MQLNLAPVAIAAHAALVFATTSAVQSPVSRAWVAFPNGATVSVEVANTETARARGLMFRSTLAPDQGMLFLFEQSGFHSFWMKNTLIPLDILWLDGTGRIVSIAPSAPPCTVDPCPSYSPAAESCAVVEVVSGFAKRHGLTIGDRVTIDWGNDTMPCSKDRT